MQRRNVDAGKFFRKIADAKKDAAKVAYLAIAQKEADEQKKKDEIQKDWKNNSSCLKVDAFVPEFYNNNDDDDGEVPIEKMKKIEIIDEENLIEKGMLYCVFLFFKNNIKNT